MKKLIIILIALMVLFASLFTSLRAQGQTSNNNQESSSWYDSNYLRYPEIPVEQQVDKQERPCVICPQEKTKSRVIIKKVYVNRYPEESRYTINDIDKLVSVFQRIQNPCGIDCQEPVSKPNSEELDLWTFFWWMFGAIMGLFLGYLFWGNKQNTNPSSTSANNGPLVTITNSSPNPPPTPIETKKEVTTRKKPVKNVNN